MTLLQDGFGDTADHNSPETIAPYWHPVPAPDWGSDAACSETDPEAFYSISADDIAAAKRVCGLCMVKEDCLTYALAHETQAETAMNVYGVWGGLDPRERLQLKALQHKGLQTP